MVSVLIIAGLICGILLSIEVGYRIRLHRQPAGVGDTKGTSSTIDAALFGLMGLMVTFTFYGAASRFDTRRNLIVKEANAIGTAFRRLDLLPAQAQPELRDRFRTYILCRIAVFDKVPDMSAVQAELKRAESLQNDIWRKAVNATRETSPSTQTLVVSSMNEMLDTSTERNASAMMHLPPQVFVMLMVTVVTSSALLGYGMRHSGRRNWARIFAFAVVLSATIYVIVDYEFPRVGLIRLDTMDQLFTDVLRNMN